MYLFLGWSVFVGLYIFVAHIAGLGPSRGVLGFPLVPTLTLVLGHHHRIYL